MRWAETTACKARYGNVAGRLFSNAEILWEESEDDYQGEVRLIARTELGSLVFYEWSYGSCSMCDDWEYRGLDDDAIEAEMRGGAVEFFDAAEAEAFFIKMPGVPVGVWR